MVPAECVLRDLPAIMLERTFPTSSLAALASADQFRAAVLLYFATYDEVPAGSLPDEPALLAQKARLTTRSNGNSPRRSSCGAGSSAVTVGFYHPTDLREGPHRVDRQPQEKPERQQGQRRALGQRCRTAGQGRNAHPRHGCAGASQPRLVNACASRQPSQSDRNAIPPRSQVQGEGKGLEESPSHRGADVIELEGRRA
jgi:hypothetical protein